MSEGSYFEGAVGHDDPRTRFLVDDLVILLLLVVDEELSAEQLNLDFQICEGLKYNGCSSGFNEEFVPQIQNSSLSFILGHSRELRIVNVVVFIGGF